LSFSFEEIAKLEGISLQDAIEIEQQAIIKARKTSRTLLTNELQEEI